MSDEPENLVLVYLRRMDAKFDRVLNELADLRVRQTDIHRAVLATRRDQTSDAETTAHVQAQLDRVRDDVETIKRRLDMVGSA